MLHSQADIHPNAASRPNLNSKFRLWLNFLPWQRRSLLTKPITFLRYIMKYLYPSALRDKFFSPGIVSSFFTGEIFLMKSYNCFWSRTANCNSASLGRRMTRSERSGIPCRETEGCEIRDSLTATFIGGPTLGTSQNARERICFQRAYCCGCRVVAHALQEWIRGRFYGGRSRIIICD